MDPLALNIKNPEADRLARELAARTGETITETVVKALSERLRRETAGTGAAPPRTGPQGRDHGDQSARWRFTAA